MYKHTLSAAPLSAAAEVKMIDTSVVPLLCCINTPPNILAITQYLARTLQDDSLPEEGNKSGLIQLSRSSAGGDPL